MERINPHIQNIVAEKVLEEQQKKGVREMTGRLSASKLGWPKQWMLLNYFKVPAEQPDEYTLRKFQRGSDVEARIVEWVNPKRKQEAVVYRGVVGVADMVLDCPVEVKSVTNMAFKHIQKDGPKRGHSLQGELYAKALGFDHYWLTYVASDDYRILTFEMDVTDETDKVIDQYEAQVALDLVPTFEPEEKWQELPKYNNYPEWMKLSEEEIAEKLKAFKK